MPTLTLFGATWCQPCQKLKPEIQDLQRELAQTCKFRYVDVDAEEDLCVAEGVTHVPYVKITHDEQVLMSEVNPPIKRVKDVLTSCCT